MYTTDTRRARPTVYSFSARFTGRETFVRSLPRHPPPVYITHIPPAVFRGSLNSVVPVPSTPSPRPLARNSASAVDEKPCLARAGNFALIRPSGRVNVPFVFIGRLLIAVATIPLYYYRRRTDVIDMYGAPRVFVRTPSAAKTRKPIFHRVR